MPSDSEAATARAAELFGFTDEAPDEQASDAEEASAEVEDQHEEAPQGDVDDLELNFSPSLPEDLEEELEAPDPFADLEEEENLTPAAEVDDEDYEDDPEKVALKKKLAAFEKRLAWEQNKRAEQSKSKWEEEAKKYFPLSEYAFTSIKATSRRGFLREAKIAHEAVLPHVKKIQDRFNAQLEAERAKAREEAKADVQQAWGKPTVNAGGAAPPPAPPQRKKQNADFTDMVKARIFESQNRT